MLKWFNGDQAIPNRCTRIYPAGRIEGHLLPNKSGSSVRVLDFPREQCPDARRPDWDLSGRPAGRVNHARSPVFTGLGTAGWVFTPAPPYASILSSLILKHSEAREIKAKYIPH